VKNQAVSHRRLFWGLLIALGLGLLILVARHDAGTIAGIALDDFSGLLIKVALLIFLGGAVFALFRDRLSAAIEALLFWLLIGLVLAAGYTYRHELRLVGDRIIAELLPGRAATRGRTVEFARTRSGEFQVAADINGARIATVLDTGASAVVLTQEAAKAAGLPIEVLNYTVSVETANGRTRAAAVTLDRLAVGAIVERAVPALVAQPGQLKTTLLGMSFLNRLEGWEVRGDKLLLRGYP
jgi:aspartyl protease family protein